MILHSSITRRFSAPVPQIDTRDIATSDLEVETSTPGLSGPMLETEGRCAPAMRPHHRQAGEVRPFKGRIGNPIQKTGEGRPVSGVRGRTRRRADHDQERRARLNTADVLLAAEGGQDHADEEQTDKIHDDHTFRDAQRRILITQRFWAIPACQY